MFNHYIIILIFLVITGSFSKIKINVKTASNKAYTVITQSGEDNKVVTGMEEKMFNITENNLKDGIKIELGKKPNDVFLKDPTPYHNLYAKYEWRQVNRNVRVKAAKVFDIVNENVTVKMKFINNYTSGKIKRQVTLKDVVENTISSSWSDKGLEDEGIIYKINVTFNNESFQFENKWRDKNFHSASALFGLSSIGHIFIESGQSVTYELKAVKTVVLVQIDYAVKLIGSVIANYAEVYGKYHFWAPSVEDIMRAAKLKNENMTTEILEIRCYLDPYLSVFDTDTLKPVPIIKPFVVKKKHKRVRHKKLNI